MQNSFNFFVTQTQNSRECFSQILITIRFIMTISIHRNQSDKQPFSSPLQCKQANNQIKTKNSLLWKAFLQFPYYFQAEERNKYIKQQQQYQFNCKNKIQLKNHIIIKRVKDFSPNFYSLQTWVVNKKSFEVVGHFQKDKNIKQIHQIFQANNQTQTEAAQTRQTTIQCTKQKSPKVQNLLFFGKCNYLKKSITINNRYVSNKHLILTKLAQKQQQQYEQTSKDSQTAYNFLLCAKKSRENTNRKSKLSHLDMSLIRKIVGYIGVQKQQIMYGVFDNHSKNGSKCYVNTRSMQIKQQERLFLCYNQMLSLCAKGVAMSNEKQDIGNIINELVREIQDKNLVEVVGRNIEHQKQMGNSKNESILIIQQKHILKSQLHVIYSRCSPYKLYANKQYNKFHFQPQPFPSPSPKPKYQLDLDEQYGRIDPLESQQLSQSPSLGKLIGNVRFNRATKKWEITEIQGIVFYKQLQKKKVQMVKQQCYFQIGGEKFVIYFNPTSSIC